MSTAGDVSTLQAALAAVAGLSLNYADVVKLLDVAILAPVVVAGRIVVRYQIGGKDLQTDVAAAQQLRNYFAGLAANQAGMQGVEVAL